MSVDHFLMSVDHFEQFAVYNKWANARLYAAALDQSPDASPWTGACLPIHSSGR
jgi:uncharacterized damage-inducible protein DinB